MDDRPDFRTRTIQDRKLQPEAYIPTRPIAFRPHLSMGLALSRIGNDFVRLPQASALGRQRSGILRQAHFITSSQEGLGEPSRAVKDIKNYGKGKLPPKSRMISTPCNTNQQCNIGSTQQTSNHQWFGSRLAEGGEPGARKDKKRKAPKYTCDRNLPN